MLLKATNSYETREELYKLNDEELNSYKEEVLKYGKSKTQELLNAGLDTYRTLSEVSELISSIFTELKTVNLIRLSTR